MRYRIRQLEHSVSSLRQANTHTIAPSGREESRALHHSEHSPNIEIPPRREKSGQLLFVVANDFGLCGIVTDAFRGLLGLTDR